MSGGVPKRISISRTQANTYCKSGGTNKVPGLVLCSRGRSRTAMCNYIKKRTNTKLSPYVKFIATGATMKIDGEYIIYDFTSNGQLTMEQVTVDEANSSKRCGPPIVGLPLIEYFMVGGGGAGCDPLGGSGGDSGAGGAGGVVRTDSITVSKDILKHKLDIKVGEGGGFDISTNPVPGLPGSESSISYAGLGGLILAVATGGGGGIPLPVAGGTGAGGSNADYSGGTVSVGQGMSGAGAGSGGVGSNGTTSTGPALDLTNGGPGTSIPANYGISAILGAGGGAGSPWYYGQPGLPGAGTPPWFFGFGGAHIGTEGPGDGGGPIYLSDPLTGTADDNKMPKDGRDGYGEGGGGGGGFSGAGDNFGKGGSGRVLIRFKHI